MSRRTRWLIGIPVAIVLLVAIAVMLVLTSPVQTAIVHRIVNGVNKSIQGKLSFGSAHASLRGLVRLNDVRLEDPDGNVVATFASLEGRVDLWALRSNTVRLHSLDLDDLRFRLVLDSAGRTNLERALASHDTASRPVDTTATRAEWMLFLDNIAIKGGPALIHNPTDTLLNAEEWTLGADVTFKERKLDYALEYDSPTQVHLQTRGAAVLADTITGVRGRLHLRIDSTYAGGYPIPAQTVGRLVADVSYEQRQDSMDIETAIESSLLGSLNGIATMMFPPGKIAGHGEFDFERLKPASLWKDTTDLELNGRLRFDKDSSQAIVNGWDIRLTFRDTRYSRYGVDDGDLRIVTADSTARITGDLDTGHGRVGINAFVDGFVPERMDVRADLRLNRVRLHDLITQAPDSLSPLTGTVLVRAHNVGSESSRRVSAVAHLNPFSLGRYDVDTLEANVSLDGTHIRIDTVTVRGYGMHLDGEAEGNLRGDVVYAVRADIPELRDIEPLLTALADTLDSLSGTVSVDLTGVANLAGGLSNLTAEGDIFLADVTYGQHYVKMADIRLVQYEMQSQSFTLSLAADSLVAAGQQLDSVDLAISGDRMQYTASVDLWGRADTMYVGADFTAGFHGPSTVIVLDSLHARAYGVEAVSEMQSTLEFSRDRIEVDAVEIRSNIGVLRASGYMQRSGEQDIVIEFSGLRTSELARIFRQPIPASNTNVRLQFTGTSEDLVGDLELSADSVVYDDKVVADNLTVQATADERITTVNGSLAMQGDTTGFFGGEFPLRISFERGVELGEHDPINGRAKLIEQRLAGFSQFLPGGTTLDGYIAADVTFKGTPANPQWLGQFIVRDARYRDARAGVDYEDIDIHGELIDDSLRISTFRIESVGEMTGSGTALMEFPLPKEVALQLQMNRFQILDSPEMRLRASGNIDVSGPLNRLTARGDLKLDEVIYRITDAATKNVEDIDLDSVLAVMRGDTTGEPGESAMSPDAIYRSMRHELHIDIPGNLWVRGSGMNIELGGELWMYKERNAEPTLTGTVQSRQGRVIILGRRFEVVSGQITFEGPMGNPRLNVLAEYTPPDQTTSAPSLQVRIYGDVKQTRVEFEGMTPEEAVQTLVGGSGGGTTSGLIERTAAGAATGQLTNFIGKWAGLDVLEYRPGSAEGPLAGGTLEVGTYVTERLFVRVRQPVESGDTGETGRIVNVEYRLLDWLKLRAEQEASTATRNGGSALDLLFQFDWR